MLRFCVCQVYNSVIFGLVIEVILAICFHADEPWYERWSLVIANGIIVIGVWMEIHFGGNVQAEAKLKTAEANARAEGAIAESAKAHERILEMKKMRSLSKEEAEALAPLLKSELFQKDPKPALRLGAVADAEAEKYAMDFQRFFESCGVNIYPTDGGLPAKVVQHEPSADGMQINVKSTENPNQAFVRFQNLMVAIGLNINVGIDPTLRDNEAMLVILKKL